MFPIHPVDPQNKSSLEQLGTKRKYWFIDEEGKRQLFKAEERDTGEDWAEKLACELCLILGIPHVTYHLAKETGGGIPGVLCETFVVPPRTLVLGNQLLFGNDSNYPSENQPKYKVHEHTVDAVAEVVRECELPPREFLDHLPTGLSTALDVFVGYVALDMWIANQDRHHENWAAIRDEEVMYLAPTFDHGASFARNLTDKERKERLTTRDANRSVAAFVRRARSAFYGQSTDRKPLLTSDAYRMFASHSQQAAAVWGERIQFVTEMEIKRLLEKVPAERMSDVCREFTLQLLLENQKRFIEEKN